MSAFDDVPSNVSLVEAGEALVFPGLVDTHVHVNEPGRTEWEGFETATRAAAAGGVTTLLDMPLNSIPATTTRGARSRPSARAARGRLRGRRRLPGAGWCRATPPSSLRCSRRACSGSSAFLVPSGVDEFPPMSRRATCARPLPIARAARRPAHGARRVARGAASTPPGPREIGESYATWLAGRPVAAETEAVRFLIGLCARVRGCASTSSTSPSAEALRADRRGRATKALPITAETCPHYLTFAAEEIPDGATEFKCAPPIRERAEPRALWEALARGRLDLVVTDHSPCPPEMKQPEDGDFLRGLGRHRVAPARAAGGLDRRARARGYARRASGRVDVRGAGPARGARRPQGRDRAGLDADLVVWDPEAEFVREPRRLQHRHKLTPYAGRTLARGGRGDVPSGRAVIRRAATR